MNPVLFLLPAALWAQAAPGYHLLYESPLSPAISAENLATLHRVLYGGEEHILRGEVCACDEPGFTPAFGYRSAKWALVDFPLDYLPMLVQHERFGHGFRFEEAGYADPTFGLNLPPPYGNGHGTASPGYGAFGVSPDWSLAISEAGMEANDVFATRLRRRAQLSGRMDFHEADLYLVNAFNRAYYVLRSAHPSLSTSDAGGGSATGSGDVRLALGYLNSRRGGRAIDGRPLDVEDLEYRVLVDFADPFAWYAAWTVLGAHLWKGESGTVTPMFHMGGTDWWPSIRSGLSPFGPEYYAELAVRRGPRLIAAYYRQADPGIDWAAGAGLETWGLLSYGRAALDLKLDIWDQPRLDLYAFPWRGPYPPVSPAVSTSRLGAGAWVSVHFRPVRAIPALGIALIAGGKTDGFAQGERLEAGFDFRAGISIYPSATL